LQFSFFCQTQQKKFWNLCITVLFYMVDLTTNEREITSLSFKQMYVTQIIEML
jgi:hypothetical protein